MADISKCANAYCPLKKNCRRYLIEPGERQAYGDFNPYVKDETIKCEFFWQVNPKHPEKRYLETTQGFLSQLWGFDVPLAAAYNPPFVPILKDNRIGDTIYNELELERGVEVFDSWFLTIKQ